MIAEHRTSYLRPNFLTCVAFCTKVRESYMAGAGFPVGFPPGYTGVLGLRMPAPHDRNANKNERNTLFNFSKNHVCWTREKIGNNGGSRLTITWSIYYHFY
jgi:hypothetical protein